MRKGEVIRTGASCLAGLLAHCVKPTVLSKPFMLTCEVISFLAPWGALRAKERTHILYANRHTMQQSLELSRLGKLGV